MICSCKTTAPVPNEYRTVPFWSWNDELEPDELVRQIRAMKQAGLGGFFMHARSGLKTAYMGERWFECVKACILEAERLGLDAWLYDEIGWPSGFGGGEVNASGDEFRQKFLRFRTVRREECAVEQVAGLYSPDGSRYLGSDPSELPAGEILEITYEVNPFYVDVLNPAVTEKFLAVTHQRYFDTLGAGLCRRIKGIFTDEPQVVIGRPVWSPTLNAAYRRRYGRELTPELPMLRLDLPGAAAFRIRFYGLVAELFSRNYTGRIGAWCRTHGWEFTGHQVQEINYAEAVCSNGAVMPHYRHYTIPGADWLGFAEPSVYVFTQPASAAAQSGRKRVMAEAFAMCGWNLNFRGMKHLYSQMQLLGINFLCTHLQSYSLRGMRKRDYPPSLAPHQPWWPDYRRLNDAFARLNRLLAEGENPVDTLVLHSQSSAWALYRDRMEDERIAPLCRSIESLSERLYRNFVPFHYADESMLAASGACAADGTLQLGCCRYRQVILPETVNFPAAVLELLRKFPGPIWRSGERHALLVDGEPAPAETAAWFEALPELPDQLPFRGILSVSGAGTVRATRRIYDDGVIYFLVNTAETAAAEAEITLPEPFASLERIDPETGEPDPFPLRDGTRFHYTFPPAGTLLLRARKTAGAAPVPETVPETAALPLPAEARLRLLNDNFLPLDRAAYSVDGGAFIDADVSSIQWRLLALRRPCDLVMRFRFETGETFAPDTPLSLVMEEPERYRLRFNGIDVPAQACGTVFDRAFRRVALPEGAVRRGGNTIELAVRFGQGEQVYADLDRAGRFETEFNRLAFDLEIEPLFLAGKFGVSGAGEWRELPHGALRQSGSFRLEALPERIDPARLAQNGLPFFAGKLALDFACELPETAARAQIETGLDGANSVRFSVDGRACGFAWCEPFESRDCAAQLRPGGCTVTLELTTSLRNLLGPFHLSEGESRSVGPLSFSREPNGVTPQEPPPYDAGYCVVATGARGSRITVSQKLIPEQGTGKARRRICSDARQDTMSSFRNKLQA